MFLLINRRIDAEFYLLVYFIDELTPEQRQGSSERLIAGEFEHRGRQAILTLTELTHANEHWGRTGLSTYTFVGDGTFDVGRKTQKVE